MGRLLDKLNQQNQPTQGGRLMRKLQTQQTQQPRPTIGQAAGQAVSQLPGIFGNALIGGAKGALSTMQGMSTLGQKGLGLVTEKLGAKPQSIVSIPKSYTEPSNQTQAGGKAGEQLAEFFVPASSSSKLIKTGEAATKALGATGKASKLINLGVRSAVGAGEFAGVTALQTGGDKEAIKEAATTGAVFPIAGTALGYGVDYYKTQKIAKSLGPNIDYSINKAIKPSVSGKPTFKANQSYYQKAREAVVTITQNKQNLKFTDDLGNVIQGQNPKSVQQFTEAIAQTKKPIFQQYDALAKQAGKKGASVDTSSVVKELDTVINNKSLQLTHPEAIQYAQAVKDRYLRAGKLETATTQDVIQNYNNALNSFYKNPSYEKTSQAAIDSMIANNLRKSLDNAITSAEGTSYQALKNQYGALSSIEKDVTHRAIVDSRKNIKGLIDFSDIFSGGQVVNGLLTMNPATISSGIASKAIASFYKRMNNPDVIITNMFNQTEKALAKQAAQNVERGTIRTMLQGRKGQPMDKEVQYAQKLGQDIKKLPIGLSIENVSKGKTKILKGNQLKSDPLIQEAKKYKTAEEFVKKQPIVYHGSKVPLKSFSNKKGGVYFTEEYADATGFAGSPDNVYEGYLNFKKPLEIDAKGAKWDKLNTKYGKSTQEVISNAQKDGYDGVVFKNIVDNAMDTAGIGESTIYYAYKPKDAFLNESQLIDIFNKANKLIK